MTDDTADLPHYFAADAQDDDELARLTLLEELCDPFTFRCLDTVGVGEGWGFLEVGAGAGSVTRWLAERVGAAGTVVAADLDPRFLAGLNEPNVEVRRCDVTADEIEPGHCDLVHARAVIMHMDDPLTVLGKLVTALRPGGWLVIEDTDYPTVEAVNPAHRLAADFDACFRARIEFLAATKIMDLRYGRTLVGHMSALGLNEFGNQAATVFDRGQSPLSEFWIRTWELTDATMITMGYAAEAQVEACRRALQDPAFLYRGALMCSVWGRRPL